MEERAIGYHGISNRKFVKKIYSTNTYRHGCGSNLCPLTSLMTDVFECLKECGFSYVRLCFAKGNPQSEHFWMKNGFERTGVEAQNEGYTVVVLEKEL